LRRITAFIFLFFVLAAGCNKDLSKQQYYDKGVKFLESGNANGAIIAFKKAIENDQNYFEARYKLGLAYLAQGKFESAEKELLKVSKLNPSYNDTHIALAKAYMGLSELNNAVTEIDRYLSKISNNDEAYEVAASIYVAKRDYFKAEEYLGKSLMISPQRLSSKIMLSDIYLLEGKTAQSETLIKEVLDKDTNNKKALYVFSRIQQKQGKNDDLISTYRKILDIDPKDINAQLELGLVYIQTMKLEKARKLAGEMQKASNKRHEGSYLMGLVYYYERKIDEALVLLQKSAEKKAIPGAFYHLGLCHLEKGDLEQATSAFQKVIDLRPDTVQPRLLLTLTHLRNGRYEEAEREAKTALDIDGENAFAHNMLGSAYLALNKGELAVEEFDRAIELDPTLVDAHIKKGNFSLVAGDEQKAEKEFSVAVKIAPDLLDSRIILAKYYIKTKKFIEAITTLEEGLRGNVNDAVLYNIIGAAHIGLLDTGKSLQSFEKAKSSNPGFLLSYFNSALVYLNKGDQEKAIKEYEKVLDISDSNITALLMLARVLEAEKRDKEALSYYFKAKKLGKVEAYMALAGYYQRKNDSKQALSVLKEALNIEPDNLRAGDMMGALYAADRNYKESLSVYRDIKDISPGFAAERIAGVYAAMGDYDKAITEMRGLLAKNKNRTDVLQTILNLYMKKKDYVSAERAAKEIISIKPGNYYSYHFLASVYREAGRIQDALGVLKKARELSPTGIETSMEMGKTYFAGRDFNKALEIFREVERSKPLYAPAYFYQAAVLEETGNRKDSVEKYKKTLELSPDYAPALNNLAYLFAEGYGPAGKAVEMARRAKELAPAEGSITDTLGWTLYNAGSYDEALKYFIEATYYLPGDPAVRYHLGLAYLKKGLRDRAEEQIKNSVRLGRRSPFAEIEIAQKLLDDIKKQ